MNADGVRGGRLVPAVLFLLLLLAVYADPVFSRRNFAGRDLLVYNLPMEKAVHDAYARGRLPVWIPEVSGGRPLLANPNMGAMYPVRPLLSVVSFPLAMRIFPVLHWMLAGIGMIVLLRAIGVSKAGAWLGAVTYVFSGVGVAEAFFPHIQPGMTLLPWVVWAVGIHAGPPSRKILVLSLLYGLLFLAGDVFTIGIAILASGLWILVEVEARERRRDLGLLAAALVLAVLLAAPQIVATLLWISETNRAVLGMQLGESLFFSIHPLRLLELVVPFPFGPTWELDITRIWGWGVFRNKAMGIFTTLYAGAFALVALPIAWKLPRRGVRFAWVLLGLSLALAILPSLVRMDSALARQHSPLPLRNPEKFAVAIVFALALLSGLALDRLGSDGHRPRWPLGVAALLAAVAVGAVLFPERTGRLAVMLVGGTSNRAALASDRLPYALAEGGLLWAVTVVALDLWNRRSRVAMVLSLGLLTAVPILASRRIAPTFTESEVFAPTLFARRLERTDPANSFRVLGESLYQPGSHEQFADSAMDPVFAIRRVWVQPVSALWGRGTVFNHDYDAGDLARIQGLRRLSPAIVKFDNAGTVLGSLALRWGIRFKDQPPLPGYARFGGDWLQDWDENSAALPDVRLAQGVVEAAGPLPAIDALSLLGPGEIVVETGREGRYPARPGTIHVAEKSPERLLLDVDAPDPTFLFVLRGFWTHRTVRLDGRLVDPVPAQLAFSAIAIPAGKHAVDWRERVPGAEVSRFGPILFGLAAAGLLIRERRRLASRAES